MKKYVIAALVLLIVVFAVQDRMAKSAARALISSGEASFDVAAANKGAERFDASMAEAKRSLAARRYGECARHVFAARDQLAAPMQRYANSPFRDGKSLRAWVDDRVLAQAGVFATELLGSSFPPDRVVDFYALAELAQALGQSPFTAAVPEYTRKVANESNPRTVVAIRLKSVPPELREALVATLAQRIAGNGDLVVFLGGGTLVESLPNLAGSALLQLDLVAPTYFSTSFDKQRLSSLESAALADSATLTLRPDDALALRSSWTSTVEMVHGDRLAAQLLFDGKRGKQDANGRPILVPAAAGTERYAGTPEEFVGAWNRHFWKTFQAVLKGIPPLTAKAPDHRARLLDVCELTGRPSTDAEFVPTDRNRLFVVVQRNDRIVRSFDLVAGRHLVDFGITHAVRVPPAFCGAVMLLVNDRSGQIERWDLRSGKLLGSVAPEPPGRIEQLNAAAGCETRVFCRLVSPANEPQAAVIDPATGKLDGTVLSLRPGAGGGDSRDLLANVRGNLLTADAELRQITCRGSSEDLVVQRGADSWKLLRRAPLPASAALPKDALAAVAGVDGPAVACIARDGLLYLPAGLDGRSGPWPLLHLPAPRQAGNRVERSVTFSYEPRRAGVTFFPAARRVVAMSATGQSIVLYGY